jgi:hypothetical protein
MCDRGTVQGVRPGMAHVRRTLRRGPIRRGREVAGTSTGPAVHAVSGPGARRGVRNQRRHVRERLPSIPRSGWYRDSRLMQPCVHTRAAAGWTRPSRAFGYPPASDIYPVKWSPLQPEAMPHLTSTNDASSIVTRQDTGTIPRQEATPRSTTCDLSGAAVFAQEDAGGEGSNRPTVAQPVVATSPKQARKEARVLCQR